MKQVSELLSRKYPQFNTVVTDCLVSDALYQMCCENVDYLIVMEDDKFKGLITDHDIASRILFENRPLNQITVNEFMNTALPVTTSETSLQGSLKLMERYGVKHLVIYDRFDFRGVVSSHEVMQEVLSQRDELFAEEETVRKGYPWNY
jgi:CBS domain-containing protein